MKKIKNKTTDNAMVGIVTAILLIGLIVIVISIIQIVYVPIIMEQREAEHRDRVAKQFGFLTSIIDDQAANEKRGIPIASFVTLGSKELPLLVSSKAYGTLEVIENSCSINIENQSTTNAFSIGKITYSSTNAYYLDQSYIYEAGAMIVSQYQGNKMMVRPGFSVDYNKTNNLVNISLNVVNISSVGLKTIAAGYGTYGVQTEFSDISKNIIINNVNNLTIATNFSNAWLVFINNLLMEAGLNSEASPNQFVLTDFGQSLRLDFLSGIKVNINLKTYEILVQVGPGWIT